MPRAGCPAASDTQCGAGMEVPQTLRDRIGQVEAERKAAAATAAQTQQRSRETCLLGSARFSEWRRQKKQLDSASQCATGSVVSSAGTSPQRDAAAASPSCAGSSLSSSARPLKFSSGVRANRQPLTHSEALAMFKTVHELPQTSSMQAWLESYSEALSQRVVDVQVAERRARNACEWEEEAAVQAAAALFTKHSEPFQRARVERAALAAWDVLLLAEAEAFLVAEGTTDVAASEEFLRGAVDDSEARYFAALLVDFCRRGAAVEAAAEREAAAARGSTHSRPVSGRSRASTPPAAAAAAEPWDAMGAEIARLMATVEAPAAPLAPPSPQGSVSEPPLTPQTVSGQSDANYGGRRKPPPPAWCVEHAVHRGSEPVHSVRGGASPSIMASSIRSGASCASGSGATWGVVVQREERGERACVVQEEAKEWEALTTQADLAVMRRHRAARVRLELTERDARGEEVRSETAARRHLLAPCAAERADIEAYLAYAAGVPAELDEEDAPRRRRIGEEENLERMVLAEKMQFFGAKAAVERGSLHADLAAADALASAELEARVRIELAFTASLDALAATSCATPLQLARLAALERDQRVRIVGAYLDSTWGHAGDATRSATRQAGEFTVTDCIRPMLIHVGGYGAGMTTGDLLPFPKVIQKYIDAQRDERFGAPEHPLPHTLAVSPDSDTAASSPTPVDPVPLPEIPPAVRALEFYEQAKRDEIEAVESQVFAVIARFADGITKDKPAAPVAEGLGPVPHAFRPARAALVKEADAEAARILRAEDRARRSLVQLFAVKPPPPAPAVPDTQPDAARISADEHAGREAVANLEASTRQVIHRINAAGSGAAEDPAPAPAPAPAPVQDALQTHDVERGVRARRWRRFSSEETAKEAAPREPTPSSTEGSVLPQDVRGVSSSSIPPPPAAPPASHEESVPAPAVERPLPPRPRTQPQPAAVTPRPPSAPSAPSRPRPASAPKGVFLTLREQRALAKAGTDAPS